jgi:hypothetical protein
MRAERSGSTVTIKLSNVDYGGLPDQTYVCEGAPAAIGDKIGVLGRHPDETHTPRIANFGNGSEILDKFNFLGRLGFTGNWIDVLIGMHGHLFFAEAGHGLHSMSFWKGEPRVTSMRPSSGAQGTTVHVRMTGLNFQPGATTVEVSGSGVSAVATNIDGQNTSTRLTAKLVIEPGAPTGTRTVKVTTPKGTTTTDTSGTFTVTGPTAACAVSLPLSASLNGGTLNVAAGFGANRFIAGTWAAGWMVFKPQSISFYGVALNSGILPAVNPPMTRNLSGSVGSVPAVAVVNAFYNPNLCGYTVNWVANASSTPSAAVPNSEVETALRSIVAEDFNGSYLEIPR